jgi:osmotically-inducible protein OsmY
MTYKSDEEIKSEVLFQLGWDTRVRQVEVGVAVAKGIVTLTGKVDSYAKKVAAKEAAHRVRGVLDVANEIEVYIPGTERHTDPEIARAVRHALDWDVLVPPDRIHSTVDKGWVTLEGDVEYYSELLAAERVVHSLAGVHGVTNNIVVSATVDPEKVKIVIEDVLALRADREANRIRVTIEGGEVTLSGAVNSWDEKKAIIGAVGHSPGVTDIRDHLFIDPYGFEFKSASAD